MSTPNADPVPLDFEREERYANLPEGSLATCRYCKQAILLDQQEGGGPAKDWGSACEGDSPQESWSVHGGIGLDYGCGDHPANDDDGTWGHVPSFETIRVAQNDSSGEKS
jgi:hypothetical protein